MKKTLVIHPQGDNSTIFLRQLWANKPNRTLFDPRLKNPDEVEQVVKEYDSIIMSGHGIDYGMFDGEFGFVFHDENAQILKDKECYFIWCYADKFVKRNNLEGFSTGMFISEMNEVYFHGLNATQHHVSHSNQLFMDVFNEAFDLPTMDDRYNYIMYKYSLPGNPVWEYNYERLYNIKAKEIA